ncbi:MAG: PD-(D/E)XK nuclease family protein [Gammaproteobacteria bacterium]|nr:PD-(D/E)XK nuclease family protein [Gammaproteobacteria bacterium]
MFYDLFHQDLHNTTVLTANNRLAQLLVEQYAIYQQALGKSVWEALDVLPYQSWLTRVHEEIQIKSIGDPLLLLSASQSNLLWETIIKEHAPLLHSPDTTYLAKQAWRLVNEGQIDVHHSDFNTTVDSESFAKWAMQYQATCEQKHWIDTDRLAAHITHLITTNQYAFQHRFILVGFVETTPSFDTLLKTLTQKGCQITNYQNAQKNVSAFQTACLDTESEIKAMATWAKQVTEANEQASIACVAPTLNTLRKSLVRIFNEMLGSKHYNISSGDPLSEEPLIAVALLLIKGRFRPLTMHEISFLLRSPAFIPEEAFDSAALLENKLNKVGNTEYTLRDLHQRLKQFAYRLCPTFQESMQALLHFETPPCHTATEWMETFSNLLNATPWASNVALSSRSIQTLEQFQKVILEYKKLDLLQPHWTFSQAFSQLKSLLAQTIFQPRTEHRPRIQVLGTLEATGMPFTHTRVMGLDSQHWPETPHPNPFIPFAIQAKNNLPHATSARELQFAKQLTKEFKEHAQHIVFSYPQQEEDCTRVASSLIKELPKQLSIYEKHLDARLREHDEGLDQHRSGHDETVELSSSPRRQGSSPLIEIIEIDLAPPVLPAEHPKGGTGILKAQSGCPFKAFAQYRLLAEERRPPQMGLTPLEKGSVLHKVLEGLFLKLQNSERLQTLCTNQDMMRSMICAHIDQALQSELKERNIAATLLALEKQRLEKVIIAWLEVEKERTPFTVVAVEEWKTFSISGLDLRLKLDRIDRLSDNTFALIDYKSGETTVQAWFGDRPEEPQLPLYIVSCGLNISSIAFAQIKANAIGFKGVSIQKGLLPNDSTLSELRGDHANSWTEQLQTWKEVLEKLANDFCEGQAAVDPKDKNKTCEYCHLHSLCRIDERL